jgi:hypothetical protein
VRQILNLVLCASPIELSKLNLTDTELLMVVTWVKHLIYLYLFVYVFILNLL